MGGGRRSLEEALRRELERLQRVHGLGLGLKVRWLPRRGGKLSGEVVGDVVYVYEADPERALSTLRHEVIDHAITAGVVKPLTGLINLLVAAIADQSYREKERLVGILERLL